MHKVTQPLIIVWMLVVFTAFSCNNEPKFDLTGQWKYAFWQMGERQVDLGALGTPIIDFKSDGTYKAMLKGNSSSEKWLLEGDTLSLIYSDGNTQKFFVNVVTKDSIELKGDFGDASTKLTLVKTKQ